MQEQRCLHIFRESIKSEITKKVYLQNLEYFREFTQLNDFDSILKIETKKLQDMIMDYVISLKSKISPNSIPTRIYPIQTFFEVNDVDINWKKIRRLFPAKVKLSGSKSWTTKEVQRMLDATGSVRAKVLVHFLASTGVRIGAMPNFRLKHLSEMPMGCKSVLVYAGEPDEYYTFLTPEASKCLNKYLEKRKIDGENLTPDSPVFRTAYQFGLGKVIPLSDRAMRTIIQRLQNKAGLRSVERKVGRNYDVQSDHGFRKRFSTILKLNGLINSNLVEKMLGHKNGLDGVYLTPTKNELFAEFRKGIADLSINDTTRLLSKNQKLEKEKSNLKEKGIIEIQNQNMKIESLENKMEVLVNSIKTIAKNNPNSVFWDDNAKQKSKN